jgi:hypothetical protein
VVNPRILLQQVGNNVNYEWIAGVEVGAFVQTNTGANGGYADFHCNQTVNLSAGASVSVTLTPGFPEQLVCRILEDLDRLQ